MNVRFAAGRSCPPEKPIAEMAYADQIDIRIQNQGSYIEICEQQIIGGMEIVKIETGFTSSLSLKNHPMRAVKPSIKEAYFRVLRYFAEQNELNIVQRARLDEYRKLLIGEKKLDEADIEPFVQSIIRARFQPWRKKYRYWLMCDLAVLLLDEESLSRAYDAIKERLDGKYQKQLTDFFSSFSDGRVAAPSYAPVCVMLEQYRENISFLRLPMKRMIVTGNMSSGKSTLINALVGKFLLRSSQEACTESVCYIYNKPFEDDRIHLAGPVFSLNTSDEVLHSFAWEQDVHIAAHFREPFSSERLCVIDTPGVNFALNTGHGNTAREALSQKDYDAVLYLFDGGKLGTESEFRHLKWVAQNVSHDCITFVVNKMDDFTEADDDIASSIQKLRDDLLSCGFENPSVYPVSAYFALLIKMKMAGVQLDEDDEDEFAHLQKKYHRPAYDLSHYYKDAEGGECDTELTALLKKCGMYGLEKLCLGGTL